MAKELIISGALSEAASFELVSLGALSASHDEQASTSTVFFEETELPVWVSDTLETYQCDVVEEREAEAENYHEECEALWYPIQIGELFVQPVKGLETSQDDKIYIIPGTGFGTGHHPTTYLMMKLLGELKEEGKTFQRAADVGSGSAILALVYAKLFTGHITAWEIDELAVMNARDNLTLNSELSKSITLHHAPYPDEPREQQNLIMANLYSSLLTQYEKSFARSLKAGGVLLLSGIMQDELLDVQRYYGNSGWKIIKSIVREGWAALYLSC